MQHVPSAPAKENKVCSVTILSSLLDHLAAVVPVALPHFPVLKSISLLLQIKGG